MLNLIKGLTPQEKELIYDEFLTRLINQNKTGGIIKGTVQIIEEFEEIAVQKGLFPCPYCLGMGLQNER
jgi:hypothetical protein